MAQSTYWGRSIKVNVGAMGSAWLLVQERGMFHGESPIAPFGLAQ